MPLRRDVPNEREDRRLRKRALLAVKLAAEPAIADQAALRSPHPVYPLDRGADDLATLVPDGNLPPADPCARTSPRCIGAVLGFTSMEGRPQKHLALIIARELASQLATATFIADTAGDLVFYNEAAEEILGRTFAEAGTMSAEGWTSQFRLEDLDGAAMSLERMPAGVALLERRPAHGKLWMTGLDGERRLIAVTAVPLFASGTEFVGMIALFWQSTPDET